MSLVRMKALRFFCLFSPQSKLHAFMRQPIPGCSSAEAMRRTATMKAHNVGHKTLLDSGY